MSEAYHLDDEVHQRSFDGALMKRLLIFVRPYRAWLALATVLLIIVSATGIYIPVLVMDSIDQYMNDPQRVALEEAGAPAAEIAARTALNMEGLLRVTLMIAGLVFIEAIIRYFQILIVSIVGQRTMMEMRVGIFDHLQGMSLKFLDRNPVGRLMSRVTSDVEKIQQTIVEGVVQVISDLLTIIVVLIVMLYINWTLAIVALLPVPFIFITSLVFRRFAQRSFLDIRKKLAAVSATMQENIAGMRVAQLFGREQASFEEYRSRNEAHRDEWLRQIRNFAVYFPLVEFLSTLSTALIVLYCGNTILSLGHEISGVGSIGTMVAFVFLAERFFGPIRALADRYNLLLEAMASSERVFKLLDTPPDIVDAQDAVGADKLRGEVAFENVSFAYEKDQWVLKDVNFHIAPGERVAIVGHTGAGKSTIINLLSRFYDVQKGAILVDGIDVRNFQQSTLRKNIGIVLQDVFLFNVSIAENIRLGNPELDDLRLRECAEFVNAARFIDKLSDGYDHKVGERGANLSTGQRQLLAFARTLAHNPHILVLDEATSSVDTETELLIQDAIEKLMQDRTSIVIAHRLSTIRNADRILVMHHGELRESGTHDELLAQNGLYRTLYELQYKDQDLRG